MTTRKILMMALLSLCAHGLWSTVAKADVGTLPADALRLRFIDMADVVGDMYIYRVSEFDTLIICPGGGQSLQNWDVGPGTLTVGFTSPTGEFEQTFSTTFEWLQYQPSSRWIVIGYESTASSFKDGFESCSTFRT